MAEASKNILRVIIDTQARTSNTKKSLKELETGSKNLQKEFDKTKNRGLAMINSIQGAMLGFGLSMLFTGMAIKNFFFNLARGMFNTFILAKGETSAAAQMVNGLIGAWEHLKYTIVDALYQTGVFEWIINKLQQLAMWVDGLDQNTKKWIGITIVAGIVIGAVMMIIGQAVLGLLGPMALVMGVAKLFSLSLGFAFLGVAIMVGFLIIAIILLFQIWTSDMSTAEKWLWTIVTVMGVLIVAMLLFGGIAAFPFILLGIGIMAVIALFALMVDKFGSVKLALLNWAMGAIMILTLVGDAIIEALIMPFRALINLINAAIRGLHAMGVASNLNEINIPDAFMLTRALGGYKEDITAKIKAEEAAQAATSSETTNITNNISIAPGEGEDSQSFMDRLVDTIMGRVDMEEILRNGSPGK